MFARKVNIFRFNLFVLPTEICRCVIWTISVSNKHSNYNDMACMAMDLVIVCTKIIFEVRFVKCPYFRNKSLWICTPLSSRWS